MNKLTVRTRWFSKNVDKWVQAFAALTIAAMLGSQLYSYYLQKKDFMYRNRPFLYFSMGGTSIVKKGKSVPPRVVFEAGIHNYSAVPALQITRYAYGVVDGTRSFEIGIKKEENNIIPPGEISHFTFSIPMQKLQLLLSARDKYGSGIILRTDYAGPLDKEGHKPYFFQEMDLPWMNAKNELRYKWNKRIGN
jgi:hypothetical protein